MLLEGQMSFRIIKYQSSVNHMQGWKCKDLKIDE